MSKFKIGDKVRITGDCDDSTSHLDGKIGEVIEVNNRDIYVSVEGEPFNWYIWNYNAELFEDKVEDKKVFTKSDLKNGDVVLKRNGNVEIVVLPLGTLVTKYYGYNHLEDINDDLTSNVWSKYDIVAVRRPTAQCACAFNAFEDNIGELVYDRERDTKPTKDTKPLYNGKVVCIDNLPGNEKHYTVGKIYQFKDGLLVADDNTIFPCEFTPVHTFEDWERFTQSKFIEVVE